MEITILSIGILFFLAHLFTAMFEKTKIPDVLLLMIIGIFVGPISGLVDPNDFGLMGKTLTTIALIVILFEGGTSLQMQEIKESAGPTLTITLITFIATVFIITISYMIIFDGKLLHALILGTILGGTSSAVVVPMVKSLKLKEKSATILVLESSITDVLCIVLTYAFLQASVSAEASFGRVFGSIISSLVFASVIGIIGGHIWLFVLNKVREFPNSILTSFAFIFILYGLAEMLGFSGAITSLAFGITLSNFSYFRLNSISFLKNVVWQSVNKTEQLFYAEIVFILKVFFFLYLGISIKIDDFLIILYGFLLIVLIYSARIIITRFSLPKTIHINDALVSAIMVPKGLAPAVLVSLPIAYKIESATTMQDIVFTVILLSIITTSALVPFLEKMTFLNRLFASFTHESTEINDSLNKSIKSNPPD